MANDEVGPLLADRVLVHVAERVPGDALVRIFMFTVLILFTSRSR